MQRQATVKLYADEIEELYRRSEEVEGGIVDLPKIDVRQDEEELKEKIGGLVRRVLGSTSLEHDRDLFSAGIDSLHVMTLVKQLKASMLGVSQEQINTGLVYSNPSITALAGALKQISGSGPTLQWHLYWFIERASHGGDAREIFKAAPARILSKETAPEEWFTNRHSHWQYWLPRLISSPHSHLLSQYLKNLLFKQKSRRSERPSKIQRGERLDLNLGP